MGEGVPGAPRPIDPILSGAQNYGDSNHKKFTIPTICTYRPAHSNFGHTGYPKMGEGVPGAPRPIDPFLSGAQNYGYPNHKKLNVPKFLLISLPTPILGRLGTQKWVKGCPEHPDP